MVESSHIELNRRPRRRTSDGLDVRGLLRQLCRHAAGERDVSNVVRVPSREAEDRRWLHREIQTLTSERTQRLHTQLDYPALQWNAPVLSIRCYGSVSTTSPQKLPPQRGGADPAPPNERQLPFPPASDSRATGPAAPDCSPPGSARPAPCLRARPLMSSRGASTTSPTARSRARSRAATPTRGTRARRCGIFTVSLCAPRAHGFGGSAHLSADTHGRWSEATSSTSMSPTEWPASINTARNGSRRSEGGRCVPDTVKRPRPGLGGPMGGWRGPANGLGTGNRHSYASRRPSALSFSSWSLSARRKVMFISRGPTGVNILIVIGIPSTSSGLRIGLKTASKRTDSHALG